MPDKLLKRLELCKTMGRIDIAGHAVVLAYDETAPKPYLIFHVHETTGLVSEHDDYLQTLKNYVMYNRYILGKYEPAPPDAWVFPDGEREKVYEYTILSGITVDGIRHVLGVDPNAEYPYFVSECAPHPILGDYAYTNALGFDSYMEALAEHCDRLSDGVEKSLAIRQERGITGTLYLGDCIPNSKYGSYKGELVVIRADVLQHDKRTDDHQLIYATHRNGCNPQARGQAVYCIDVYDGKQMRYERYDVLGIIRPEAIPAWAEPKIAEIKARQLEKQYDNPAR